MNFFFEKNAQCGKHCFLQPIFRTRGFCLSKTCPRHFMSERAANATDPLRSAKTKYIFRTSFKEWSVWPSSENIYVWLQPVFSKYDMSDQWPIKITSAIMRAYLPFPNPVFNGTDSSIPSIMSLLYLLPRTRCPPLVRTVEQEEVDFNHFFPNLLRLPTENNSFIHFRSIFECRL